MWAWLLTVAAVLLFSGWMMGAEAVWTYFDTVVHPRGANAIERPAGLVVEAPRGNADGWSG